MALHAHSDTAIGPAGYGGAARHLHWATAALIAVNVALGLYSASLPREAAWRQIVLGWHKSFGLLLIALTLARLAGRLFVPVPDHVPGARPWEVLAARLGHGLLYLVLLAMPLSGLLWAQGGAREVTFFDLFTVPQVIALQPGLPVADQPYYRLGKALHEAVFQWLLYAAFALHMAGVIKHQVVDGDRTFISRMWGRPAR